MIVLDLEFNQAFDFGDGGRGSEPDPRCRFEIIQIGAVKVDGQYNATGNFNILIKPILYPKIHPYVEKITGFKNADFYGAPNFPEAYTKFREFIGDDLVLGTWGYSDIKALYRNITYHGLTESSVIMKYVDIQRIATKYVGFSKGGTIGLKNAVEALDITIDEDKHFHNALSDAYYTAEILKKIDPDKPTIRIFNSRHIK